MPPLLTFTSDYGVRDEYVGRVKGVILGLCPEATIVDLTHEIAPQAVEEGAWLLRAAASDFPDGTIHLAVVDPGVGTARRSLAARTRRALWVGPDNGLFSLVFESDGPAAVVEIDRRRFLLPSTLAVNACGEPATTAPPLVVNVRALTAATFDGRDLFAPVAARLACGSPLGLFGSPIDDWVRLSMPEPGIDASADCIDGEIIRIDRFGNLISNITTAHLTQWLGRRTVPRLTVQAGTRSLPFYRSYAEAPKQSAGALINSSGYLELFAAEGSAQLVLRADKGMAVIVKRLTKR